MWGSLNNFLNDLDGAVKESVEILNEENEQDSKNSSNYHSNSMNNINNHNNTILTPQGRGRISPYDPNREVIQEYEETSKQLFPSSSSSSSSSSFYNGEQEPEQSQNVVNNSNIVRPVAKKMINTNTTTTNNNNNNNKGGVLKVSGNKHVSSNTTTIPNNTYDNLPLPPLSSHIQQQNQQQTQLQQQQCKKVSSISTSSGIVQTTISGNVIRADSNHKQMEAMKNENIELEKEIEGLKKEIQSAWKTYKSAQEVAAAREGDLKDEILQLKKAKEIDRKQMVAQMESAGDEFDVVKEKLVSLDNEKESLLERLEQAQEQCNIAERKASLLEADLISSQTGSLTSVQSVQERLRQAELSLDEQRAEHATALRKIQTRYTELETTHGELAHSLAERDREVNRLQGLLAEAGNEGSSKVNRELDGLRQQNDELSSMLEHTRSNNIELEKKIKEMDSNYRANQMAFEDERQRAKESSEEWVKQVADLRERLEAAATEADNSRNHNSSIKGSSNVSELEEQVQNLGNQLLRKQKVATELMAEKSGMQARLQQLQSRCELAETELSKFKDVEGGDFGSPGGISSDGLAKRNKIKMSSEIEKFGMKAGPGVKKAIDGFDSITISSGRFLRSYPLLRFGFVLYLAILHLWVFIALSYASSNLDEEAALDPLNTIIQNEMVHNNNGPGPR